MPELRELLEEILQLETWKEIDKRFIAFRRRAKFVPKKNVMYHLYMAQEVRQAMVAHISFELHPRFCFLGTKCLKIVCDSFFSCNGVRTSQATVRVLIVSTDLLGTCHTLIFGGYVYIAAGICE